MKKLLVIFLLLIPITLAETMTQDQTIDFNNREIKILGIQESKILISVNGEKNIVSLNKEKTINGVNVLVTEIFFADETSTTTLDLSLIYTCGNGKCDPGETTENCCKDCGCSTTAKCIENICIIPECSTNNQCEDNNPLTEDSCKDFKCKNKEVRCKKNIDCNDNNVETEDVCYQGNCQNLQPLCSKNIDCDDQNPCTLDKCENKDCFNTKIENCTQEEDEEPEKIQEVKITEESKNDMKEESVLKIFLIWLSNLFK